MDILKWSDLIYQYYFERDSGDRVILHISMQDLIDFAKEENVEISRDKFASSLNDDLVRNDFVRKFWNYPNGNRDLRDLQTRINQIVNDSIKEGNFEILLAILALLIMPICENDDLELHGRDYYGHLFPFLISNNLINGTIKDTVNWSRNFLGTIHLDKIYEYLSKWSKDNNLNFTPTLVLSENKAKLYALTLMKESLLSPSKIQRFGFLFDKAGFVPKANLEDEILFSAFTNYFNQIGISVSKFKSLTAPEFYGFLASVLRSEYDRWDGTTRFKERDRSTGKIKVEAGNTCYPLLLQMDYDLISNSSSFAFLLQCSDMDNMDYLSFVKDDSEEQLPDVYIKNDGFANKPFKLEDSALASIFSINHGCYCIHEKFDKSLKGRHVVTDYYILKLYKNKYIATNEFIKGEFYFALIRNESTDEFSSWISANNAVLINDKGLGGFYSIYRIDHAVAEMPSKNNLRFKTEIRCKSINNLEVKTSDDTDVIYLSDLLSAQFEISGVDVSKDKIFAVTVNCAHRDSSELKYDHDRNLWILKPFTHIFQKQKEFQLYCNAAPIPFGRTYKFMDFVLPKDFKEIPLDQWGRMNDTCLSKGLELSSSAINKNLINWDTLKFQMGNAHPKQINFGSYKEKDILLYCITSASYKNNRWLISMPWLKEIRDRLSSEFDKEDNHIQSDRYSLSNALADYFRMGYINYAYTENGLRLTANRPTLILLTPQFERSVSSGLHGQKMVRVSCVEKNFKCLLTGGRTIALIRMIEKYQQSLNYKIEYLDSSDYLQPQTIYIHAESRSVFKELAEKCNLLYQDNIYANALINALPTVEDYIRVQKQNGTERDLFGVRSYRTIDYSKMASIYPIKLASKQAVSNHEIDKDIFDNQNDVVTFFPGSRDETTVMIENGRMFEIDKYWGHFVGMYKAQAKVLHYDEDSVQISMPQQFRLPLMYARALTLLNGSTPDSVFGSRTYSLGVNPCTFDSHPENILNKLGQ